MLEKPVMPPSREISEMFGETKRSKKAYMEWELKRSSAPRNAYVKFDPSSGPLLVTTSRKIHWLTRFERFKLLMGFETAETLNKKYSQEH